MMFDFLDSGQMPWSSWEVSRYGQREIGHVALNVHPLYGIWLIDGCLAQYG